MDVHILVVESDPEDALFLLDVIQEIEDQRHLREWAQIHALHAALWSEAEPILSSGAEAAPRPHAVLLSLNLADTQGVQTFLRSQAVAPDIPVILLVEPGEEALAARLIREGAQDFLIKAQVDAAPLAHALANAMDRQRILSAARAAVFHDALTGLPNRTAFLSLAARDRRLAERLRKRWMVLIAEPRSLRETAAAWGDQRRDLELVETADHLRRLASPADVVARLSDSSFALSVFDSEQESVEETWMRIRLAGVERRIDIGACIFDPARPLTLDTMLENAAADLAPRESLTLAHASL